MNSSKNAILYVDLLHKLSRAYTENEMEMCKIISLRSYLSKRKFSLYHEFIIILNYFLLFVYLYLM